MTTFQHADPSVVDETNSSFVEYQDAMVNELKKIARAAQDMVRIPIFIAQDMVRTPIFILAVLQLVPAPTDSNHRNNYLLFLKFSYEFTAS